MNRLLIIGFLLWTSLAGCVPAQAGEIVPGKPFSVSDVMGPEWSGREACEAIAPVDLFKLNLHGRLTESGYRTEVGFTVRFSDGDRATDDLQSIVTDARADYIDLRYQNPEYAKLYFLGHEYIALLNAQDCHPPADFMTAALDGGIPLTEEPEKKSPAEIAKERPLLTTGSLAALALGSYLVYDEYIRTPSSGNQPDTQGTFRNGNQRVTFDPQGDYVLRITQTTNADGSTSQVIEAIPVQAALAEIAALKGDK